MHPLYERILKQPETVTPEELERQGEHALCYSALRQAALRQVPEARRLLRQLDEAGEPACPVLLEARALFYYSQREPNAARDAAARAVEADPGAFFALSVLGGLATAARRYPQASEYYRRALEVHPESDRTRLHLAQAQILGGDRNAARRSIDLAQPSARRRLYSFYVSFFTRPLLLLWFLLVLATLLNVYVFLGVFAAATLVNVSLYLKYGYRQSDWVIGGMTLLPQIIHTFFFALVACQLLDGLLAR